MNFMQMSFSGAVFIIAVLIIRKATINRLPKKTFLVLWELVLLRLLIPFSIPSIFSIYTFIPAFPRVETGNVPAVAILQTQPVTMQLPASSIPFVSVRFIIWCIGMILCAAVFAVFYLRCLMEFQISCPVQSNYAEQWIKEHPLKRPLTIRQSDRIPAPLTYGIFHPVILMPAKTDWSDTKQLQYILLHEYVHICRFDTVRKLVMILALCLHWFNPMVWVMYILFNRDIELSCDESVIRKLGENSRAAYAQMLVYMETKKSGLAPLCNNFSKNVVEERITAIMKIKKITIITIISACFIILSAACVFATSAAASTDNQETAFVENNATSEDYAVYRPFGLTVDNGKLYYEGQLVRCFDDWIYTKNFSTKAIEYYEKNGTIDVHTIRENTGSASGELTGLETATQEEFQNWVITDHSEPIAQTDSDMFSAYEKYGLSYDKSKKAFFYDGNRVRLFWDSCNFNAMPKDSEKLFGNSISSWDSEGVIDLYAVRDFTQTDQDGYGKLDGLRIATQEEFDANTEAFLNQDYVVETAR